MKHLEIENKYLLSYEKALDFINSLREYNVEKIEQAYFSYSPKSTKRVRKSNDKYILTIKKGSGRIREEFEKNISKKKYKKLIKKKIGRTIKKNRYIFELEGYKFELDIFKKSLKGLAFLEIEFKDEKEQKSFTPPNPLKEIIIKDVSEDRSYTNAFLAISMPDIKDINKIFKKIELNPSGYKFKPGKKINIHNFLMIRLYGYLMLAKHHADQFSTRGDDEDLHQFRVNIRKIRSLLWSFREILDKNIYLKLSASLKSAANRTNQKRDTDVFLTFLEKYKKDYKEFYSHLKQKQSLLKEDIGAFFNSKELEKTVFDLELFLKDENGFFINSFGYISSCFVGQQKIKNLSKKVKHLTEKLSSADSIEKYHKIRIKIKKLRYLLETFSFCINDKKTRSFVKKLQDSFGILNDTYNHIMILNRYISSHQNGSKNLELLLSILETRLQDNKTSIIRKIRA
jgi:CHAD domain-containing protein/CYTH domain-containing protein